MKVLVTSRSFSKVSNEPIEILNKAGIEVDSMAADYTDEKFAAAILEYDALIIGAHKFPPELMKKCGKLKIIAKHGAGLDNIPLETAKELGITVTNVPAMNANAVADLAIGLMLNLCRGLALSDRRVRAGEWKSYIGKDMYAKTLGLVGFGNIAKNVARRAHGFSMQVLAYDPFVKEVPEEFKEYVTLCSLEEILPKADFISIHVPLTSETKYMFNKESMRTMKEGAFLINTSRGGIANEADLYEVCKEGYLGGAAFDVTEKEPMDPNDPLMTLDNIVVTPHIGMYSFEAVNIVSLVCARNVAAKLRGEAPEYIVV